ncbi:MAG: type II toxin-antitoxin system HicA family toxin [Chloroflexota bacterium]|nr:type II toxin-antitoxin system HicA family toxin [Chloroflexota bacterium]MDE2635230.1 type II toxin-antitoxin system HicA family toxin [Chloroflexota bacterium]
MPKRRVLSAAEVRKILILNGFDEVRQKGSHIVFRKRQLLSSGKHTTYTTIVPNHKEIDPGTLGSIIRKSGLPKELFDT